MELSKIEIVRLVVNSKPGESIGQCIKEAIELSANEWRNVELKHNGRSYMIRPNDLIAAINEAQND